MMGGDPAGFAVRQVEPPALRDAADGLAALLLDCVEGGASIGYLYGLDHARARRFWLGVAAAAESDGRAVFVATRDSDGLVAGTVQMIPVPHKNQPHRAEIAKMLVHRAARRRGLGAALMRAAEAAALNAGRTLLTLDTASDDAERLYSALGWTKAGTIPGYALMPDGSLCATSVYYTRLAARPE